MALRGLATSLTVLLLLTEINLAQALLAPAANAQIRTEAIAAKPPGGIAALMLIAGRATLKNNHRQYFTITLEAGAAEFDKTDAAPA